MQHKNKKRQKMRSCQLSVQKARRRRKPVARDAAANSFLFRKWQKKHSKAKAKYRISTRELSAGESVLGDELEPGFLLLGAIRSRLYRYFYNVNILFWLHQAQSSIIPKKMQRHITKLCKSYAHCSVQHVGSLSLQLHANVMLSRKSKSIYI